MRVGQGQLRGWNLALAATIAVSVLAIPAAATDSTVLFILDGSGSMWGRLQDGQPKITVAKDVLSELLRDIPANISVGLMVYGHRRKGDCTDIELIQPPASGGAASADAVARAVNPRGKTPISTALMQAGQTMANLDSGAKTIVLVSDGIETCKGDPCAVAESLAKADASVEIHVVGYDVDPRAATQLACVAAKGRGTYFAAKNADGLKTALSAVTNHVAKNEPIEPPPKVAAPTVAPTSKSKRIKIAGPGTIKILWPTWNKKRPYYWKLIDPEHGNEVLRTSATQLKVRPGSYQIVWRQSQHGSREVVLSEVISVESKTVTEFTPRTGLRLVPPASIKRPYYWRLLSGNDSGSLRMRGKDIVASFSLWDAVPVPAGTYRLALRQSEHGHGVSDLGLVTMKNGVLTEVLLDQGINLQWPEEWSLKTLYYLKVTDEAGRVSKFRYRGPVVLRPGNYEVAVRLKQHGWSDSPWGKVTVPEKGFVDLKLISGIRFLSNEKSRHTIYAVNLETGKESSISNHWGPLPLLPGRYRLDYKPERSNRYTIVDQVTIPDGTMVEAEM